MARAKPPHASTLPPEAELARLWAAQALGGRLVTEEGVPVTVRYPGRPGGAGPDFRDAVIQFGAEPARVGDVELHRRAGDFAGHGHAADPAYDRVLLHVVFTASGARRTLLPSGREAPVLAVPAAADAPPAPLREPCITAPARLSAEGVQAVLRDAGLWRLRRKAEALVAAIAGDGPDQALYAAVAAALGQTANARGLALLAERAPLRSLAMGDDAEPEAVRAAAVERRLLHAAGLDGALLAPAPALPWVISGVRPAAHPARRIGALARLLVRLSRPDLAASAAALVDDARRSGTGRLVDALTVAAPAGPALCGRARAVELAVNALLPWAAARATLNHGADAADAILTIAGNLPAAERYGSVAHLDRNLRDGRGRRLLTSALVQQGALAMLGEWCRRGGCGRCPLS